MPVSNVPETARIVRVTHAPAGSKPVLAPLEPGGAPVEGAAAVSELLRALNAETRGASGCGPLMGGLGERGAAAETNGWLGGARGKKAAR